MSPPRRKITIRMSPRDLTDSPKFLEIIAQAIAQAFPDADVDISLGHTQEPETAEDNDNWMAQEPAKVSHRSIEDNLFYQAAKELEGQKFSGEV